MEEKNTSKEKTRTFNKQSTTQPHQIHGPHFFFPFRYGTKNKQTAMELRNKEDKTT
jgi:hypothetical protein